MITVKLNNLKVIKGRVSLLNNSNVGLEVSGHAMAGKHGEDIVCAAVSTVAQTTAISLIELAEIKVKIKQHDGFLSLNCPNIKEAQFEKFLTIMNVFWIGIREIAKLYPDKIKTIGTEDQ